MGENEQSGLLRNVVVVGIISMVALVVIFAVVGLTTTSKSSISDSLIMVDKLNGTDDYDKSEFKYTLNDTDHTASVDGYKDSNATVDPDLTIYKKVYKGKQAYTVTSIGRLAFWKLPITSVTIPDTIKVIGDDAFYNDKLTSVTIPDSVTSIGVAAFQGNKLTSATMSMNVKSYPGGAFYYNPLKEVTVAKGAVLNETAFDPTTSVKYAE